MIIKLYTETDTSYDFKTYKLPETMELVQLPLSKDTKDGNLGDIEFIWYNNDVKTGCEYNSETLYFHKKNYITVNDKKFVITDENDLKDFYHYLTGEDVDLYLKDFLALEKEATINKDF
jgi:hypothetical protein